MVRVEAPPNTHNDDDEPHAEAQTARPLRDVGLAVRFVRSRQGRRRLRIALLALSLALVGWLGASFATLHYVTRRAEPPFDEPAPPPAGAVELSLEASDGVPLRAWFVGDANADVCILMVHGNGGSRGRLRPLVDAVAREDRAILALTLRGHGDSGGERNDIGPSARRDIIAGVELLEERVDACAVVVVGRSLGSAAALLAAPTLEGRVDGYFLESPYTALDEAIQRRADDLMPRLLSAPLIAGMRLWSPLFVDGGFANARPIDALARVDPDVPVVLINGTADRRVTAADIEAFVGRRPTETYTFFIDGAAHAPPLFQVARDEYLDALQDLLNRVGPAGVTAP